MSGGDEGSSSDEAPLLHLEEASGNLLLAQLHLAAVEGSVCFEDLVFVRRLIAIAMEQVTALNGPPPNLVA